MADTQWILCPICKNKTRIMIRKDTELKNFPLFCPKCKHERRRADEQSEKSEFVGELLLTKIIE